MSWVSSLLTASVSENSGRTEISMFQEPTAYPKSGSLVIQLSYDKRLTLAGLSQATNDVEDRQLRRYKMRARIAHCFRAFVHDTW